MPYLQLDVNATYPIETKKTLARRLMATYADVMQADVCRISVTIRELGEGSIWRMVDGVVVPAAVLMCDIRQGRPPEQRLRVARALSADCVETLGLRTDRLNVEFTQHAGNEMYHPTFGGFSPEWSDSKT